MLYVFNSYNQLAAGQHTAGSIRVLSGWDFNCIGPSETCGTIRMYTFTLPTGWHYNATATLVWQRRAGETSIANLDLSLDSGTTPYKASTSTVDNVEHISYKDLQPDIYLLTVTRNSDTLGGNEPYALAFNFAAIPNVISRKAHAPAGSFDMSIFPPLPGRAVGVESRIGAGTNRDQHQLVFTFPDDAAHPSVTLANAAVTAGSGQRHEPVRVAERSPSTSREWLTRKS